MTRGLSIRGTGSAVPQGVLTNDMLAEMVDTSDEWITSRTGIASRHIARGENTHTLALEAASRALEAAALPREAIGLVICATVTNERSCPPLACLLQRDLGLRPTIFAFDLNAACSGFVYALITARALLAMGDTALIVGSEVLTRFVDFTDRKTCVLFGDGAGAVVVRSEASPFSCSTEVQGDDDALSIDTHIHMEGQVVFKFAVEALVEHIRAATEQLGWRVDELDHVICHQANERIIASAAKRLGLPLERFFMNIASHGNTSAASIPLALDEAVREGRLLRGQRLALAGFGGGLTAGTVCMRW
jgi:3-oxoacyl-[acyl-carrier-protein] synthase-3